MTRPARSIRPLLEQCEKKTLLSAGQLGHIMAGSPGPVALDETGYLNYLYVKTDGKFEAKDVKWDLFGTKMEAGRRVPNALIESGSIGNVGASPKLIKTTKPSLDLLPDPFELKYKVNGKEVRVTLKGTSFAKGMTPPLIAEELLPESSS